MEYPQFESLLATQNGVITTAQALQAGLSKYDVEKRVAEELWQTLYRGVHLTMSFPPLFEQWCQAAQLKVEGCVLWAESAARLHALDGYTPPPAKRDKDQGVPIHVAIPRTQFARPQKKMRVARVSSIEEQDVTVVGGLTTASVVRALIDAAEHASWRKVVMSFEHVHRRGHHRWLAERVDALTPYRPWLRALEDLMGRRGPNAVATESAAEAVCDDILWRGGFRAERQLRVETRQGSRRIDLAFPEAKLGIECDSRSQHAAERAFDQDRARWAELIAEGWTLLHFTWSHFRNEAFVRAAVRDALAARAS